MFSTCNSKYVCHRHIKGAQLQCLQELKKLSPSGWSAKRGPSPKIKFREKKWNGSEIDSTQVPAHTVHKQTSPPGGLAHTAVLSPATSAVYCHLLLLVLYCCCVAVSCCAATHCTAAAYITSFITARTRRWVFASLDDGPAERRQLCWLRFERA